MEERIYLAVAEALAQAGAPDTTFAVEWPADMAHGDYAVNAAMAAAKALGKNPRALAEELAPHIQKALGDAVDKVEVAGPGFINITLSTDYLDKVTKSIVGNADWGKGRANAGVKVMVEYTDPNPFKELHIGHLMSNAIGEALSRLIEASGAETMRANYQGDVGPHVAKALWGLMDSGITEPATAAELGKAYTHGAHAYEASPKAKEEIDAINRAVYAGSNPEIAELWRKGRDVSLEAFEDLYRILGTKFDYYFFESDTAEPGMELVRDGIARGIFDESDGAVIYRGEKKGLHTLVFITSHGTPTYETKDIGLAFLKEERWPSDQSIIITANEQIGHFKVFLAALEDIAPLLAKKTVHIPHGFLRLTSGKMSSREGNVITARDLIEETLAKAGEKNDDPLIAEQVAIGAIKYMILRAAPGSDIVFDPEQSLSLEGDSGPYLQYALVRARSVLAQAQATPSPKKDTVIYESVENSSREDESPAPASNASRTLARLIVRFPEVVARAGKQRAPQQLTTYLTQLAGEWNSFYAAERIIGGERESYNLMLAESFAHTMQAGLTLLGIPTPEKM